MPASLVKFPLMEISIKQNLMRTLLELKFSETWDDNECLQNFQKSIPETALSRHRLPKISTKHSNISFTRYFFPLDSWISSHTAD